MQQTIVRPNTNVVDSWGRAPFNRDQAMSHVEDDMELLVELAEMFVADAPAQLTRIRQAVAQGDSEDLRIAAHTLKGAASNFCAADTVEAARHLEFLGREGTLGEASAALAIMETQLYRLCEALEVLIVEASTCQGTAGYQGAEAP